MEMTGYESWQASDDNHLLVDVGIGLLIGAALAALAVARLFRWAFDRYAT